MKLHLGCGDKKIDGFLNVDIINNSNVDLVDDVTQLKSIKNESVDLIYACHVLEHFKRNEYLTVLKRWTELLKPNGVLRLSVPDLEKVIKLYNSGKYNLRQLLGLLYGGQTYLYNFHYMGFDFITLKEDLEKLNYFNIKKFDWRLTEHAEIDDYSQAYLPHMDKKNGELVSLNIEAIKK